MSKNVVFKKLYDIILLKLYLLMEYIMVNNKKEVTDLKMFGLIVGRFIALIIAFSLLASASYSVLELYVENEWIKIIAAWLFQFIAIFISIFYSIKVTFATNTIAASNKNGLIKKLIITIIVLCIFNFGYGMFSVERKIQNNLESNVQFQMMYKELKENATEESFKKYEEMLDKELDKIRINGYKNVAITQTIKSAMYICMIPVIKRMINKEVKCEDENC